MTREEVIERLRLILKTDIMTLNGFNIPHEPLEKEIEALKIVIKVLEQEPILDKIRAEIEKEADTSNGLAGISEIGLRKALKIIDKHKAESEKMSKHWIDDADHWICPDCGFITPNPNRYVGCKCPKCGFQAEKDKVKSEDKE